MPQTLADWLDWQSQLNPKTIELGLTRVKAVWAKLNGKLSSQVITVAGTNGKGSSVAMLESILLAAGFSTGSYTSPHIHQYNERIRLDSQPVSDEQLCQIFEQIEQARDDIPLTYFEYGTLAGLLLFMEHGPDVVILEVGLGGRLDAVNMIDADVALITGIALDHQDWLGDDIESIGKEKAGIMRSSRPVVYASPDMPQSIRDTAAELKADLIAYGTDYVIDQHDNAWAWQRGDSRRSALPFPALRGKHQVQNAAGVLSVLDCVKDQFPVDQKAVREGLSHVALEGRFQVLSGDITWIYDVAHNPQAAETLLANVQAYPLRGKCYAVLAMLEDKDNSTVMSIMDIVVDGWFVAGLDIPRGMDIEAWKQLPALASGKKVNYADNLQQALQKLELRLLPGDSVIVFGSFYTVAEVMQARGQQPGKSLPDQ